MVKFYIEVFILFFNNPEYGQMMNTEGIEKIPIEDRKWSHYIEVPWLLSEIIQVSAKSPESKSPKGRKIFWRPTIWKTILQKQERVDRYPLDACRQTHDGRRLFAVYFEKLARK